MVGVSAMAVRVTVLVIWLPVRPPSLAAPDA
jgi:hypothetical protein